MKKLLSIFCLVVLSAVAFAQSHEVTYVTLADPDHGFPFERPPLDTGIVGEGHLFSHNNPVQYNPDGSMRLQKILKPGYDGPTITMWVKNSQAKTQADEFKSVEVYIPTEVRYNWQDIFANKKDGTKDVAENGITSFKYTRNQIRLKVVQQTMCTNVLELERGDTRTPKYQTKYILYVDPIYNL